jgi:hypothetical protein
LNVSHALFHPARRGPAAVLKTEYFFKKVSGLPSEAQAKRSAKEGGKRAPAHVL